MEQFFRNKWDFFRTGAWIFCWRRSFKKESLKEFGEFYSYIVGGKNVQWGTVGKKLVKFAQTKQTMEINFGFNGCVLTLRKCNKKLKSRFKKNLKISGAKD